jgi:hypothetical protein
MYENNMDFKQYIFLVQVTPRKIVLPKNRVTPQLVKDLCAFKKPEASMSWSLDPDDGHYA